MIGTPKLVGLRQLGPAAGTPMAAHHRLHLDGVLDQLGRLDLPDRVVHAGDRLEVGVADLELGELTGLDQHPALHGRDGLVVGDH